VGGNVAIEEYLEALLAAYPDILRVDAREIAEWAEEEEQGCSPVLEDILERLNSM
jgi:hypothetical protein